MILMLYTLIYSSALIGASAKVIAKSVPKVKMSPLALTD